MPTATRDTVLRSRLVERAAEVTGSEGWAAVTMARLADDVGVSRQTVYNEVGGKAALAEAMVLRELADFLDLVDAAFDQAHDVVSAIERAATAVLTEARGNPLLRAVLSSTHGADSELLPLLTTHSEALLDTAARVIREHVHAFDLDLTPGQVDAAIDMVVRLVLSHVMQPAGTPEQTGADIAWIAARVLEREPSGARSGQG